MRTKMRTIYPSVFRKPEVIRELDRFREKFFSVSAGKACNNIVFVTLLLQFHFKRPWYSVQTPISKCEIRSYVDSIYPSELVSKHIGL